MPSISNRGEALTYAPCDGEHHKFDLTWPRKAKTDCGAEFSPVSGNEACDPELNHDRNIDPGLSRMDPAKEGPSMETQKPGQAEAEAEKRVGVSS